MDRRTFLRAGVSAAGLLTIGRALGRFDVAGAAGTAAPGPGPYGALDGIAPDANGLILPPGFTSRVVAQAGQVMPGTGYEWHTDPDGGAVFPMSDGGWLYASNQEERLILNGGGVGVLRFAANGNVVDAYRVLNGTYTNCAGGPTPWGTWLSCEEHPLGQVWECDPTKPGQGIARPAMGRFWHEAVAVDPVGKRLYMTEDAFNGERGYFYRFTPTTYPNLASGLLEAASMADDGSVTWVEVDTSTPVVPDTVDGATMFPGGEGVWYHDGVVFFTTKSDDKVWRLDVAASKITVLYDPAGMTSPPLSGVDNCVVSRSGDLFVAEDGGNMELVLISPEGVVAPFLRVVEQDDSEISGPAFDPSGNRLYFSSMRGETGQFSLDGIVYEVTGPFRSTAPGSGTSGGGLVAPTGTTSAGGNTGGSTLPATGGGGQASWGVLALLGAAGAAGLAARSAASSES
jgi:uncharacterized protein